MSNATFTKAQQAFMEKNGTKDDPDLPLETVELLMDDHYYVISDDLQGYFMPKDNMMYTELEDEINATIKLHEE